jgi:hypothetical protein
VRGAIDRQVLEIHGRADQLLRWAKAHILRTIERMRERIAGDQLVLVRDDGTLGPCRGISPALRRLKCRSGSPEELNQVYLVSELGLALGDWHLMLTGPNSSDEKRTGLELLAVIEAALDGERFYPWKEIAEARLTNFSGIKTGAAIIAYAGLSVALAPVGLLGSGLGGGRFGSGGSSGGGALGKGGRVLGGAGSGTGPTIEGGKWLGHRDEASEAVARPLFDAGLQRRSTARLVVSSELGSNGRRVYPHLLDGLGVGVRLFDLSEIGGGVKHVWARTPSGAERSEVLGFGRVNLHLPLDAEHRWALPLGIDFGGGGDNVGGYFRLNAGLQRRFGDTWFAGVFAGNPTYLKLRGRPRNWSFDSGIEIGAAF